MIPLLSTQDAQFSHQFQNIKEIQSDTSAAVEQTVRQIIATVRREGDAALLKYTQQFDGHAATSMGALTVGVSQMERAWQGLSADLQQVIATAAQRIRDYHQHQKEQSWQVPLQESDKQQNHYLGQRVTPMSAVGVYVPGGRASYPSSVLMNVIPAQIAEVPRIVAVVPAQKGQISPMVLAALHFLQISEVYTIGGAQAVAALAYGTNTIAPVVKIVGPGNAYVAEAKRQVFGKVGIDSIAGPSEVVVIAGDDANPDWVAADLLAQAEHDPLAQAILLTPSLDFQQRVLAAVNKWLVDLPRQEILKQSLSQRSALILVRSWQEAVDIANQLAPEHLELATSEAIYRELLPSIEAAGAIFLGHHSAEVFGDYCVGTNHVLPTSGAARFSSPLGVYDFQKRTAMIAMSRDLAKQLSPIAEQFATSEGLMAHALAARLRQ